MNKEKRCHRRNHLWWGTDAAHACQGNSFRFQGRLHHGVHEVIVRWNSRSFKQGYTTACMRYPPWLITSFNCSRLPTRSILSDTIGKYTGPLLRIHHLIRPYSTGIFGSLPADGTVDRRFILCQSTLDFDAMWVTYRWWVGWLRSTCLFVKISNTSERKIRHVQ